MYIQHSLTELAAFQGLSRDTCWAVQHLSVQFLRARVVPGTQWESHACCSKFLLLDFHFCLFCLRGNVPLPCDRNPSKLIYKPSGGETKAYTLILPQSTLSRRQSLNLELQFTSPRLGLCFLFCPECSFCFSFKK